MDRDVHFVVPIGRLDHLCPILCGLGIVDITDSAFANCHNLADIDYPKTAEDWAKVVKSSNWNHEMNITIHCSDKKIEN